MVGFLLTQVGQTAKGEPIMSSTNETLELLKKIQSEGSNEELRKSISTSTGLVAYDLQAPAKNLYPV